MSCKSDLLGNFFFEKGCNIKYENIQCSISYKCHFPLVKYFHLLVVTWTYLSKFKCVMTLDVLFSNTDSRPSLTSHNSNRWCATLWPSCLMTRENIGWCKQLNVSYAKTLVSFLSWNVTFQLYLTYFGVVHTEQQ